MTPSAFYYNSSRSAARFAEQTKTAAVFVQDAAKIFSGRAARSKILHQAEPPISVIFTGLPWKALACFRKIW